MNPPKYANLGPLAELLLKQHIEMSQFLMTQVEPPPEPEISVGNWKLMVWHNERLTRALKSIVNIPNQMVGGDWDEIDEARKIAQAALNGEST